MYGIMCETVTSGLLHPPGMLHREQRTAVCVPTRVCSCGSEGATRVHARTHRTRRTSSSDCERCGKPLRSMARGSTCASSTSTGNRRAFKFAKSTVFCVCLTWVMMSISMANGAPTTNGDSPDDSPRLTGYPRWINPCGIDDSASIDMVDFSTYVPDLAAVLDTIVQQANLALDEALAFKVEFIQHNFGHSDFESHHRNYPERMDWLPLPENKELGIKIPDEHLKPIQLKDALVSAYEMLQYYAVALEQVVFDLQGEALFAKFRSIENHLRSVLSEVQSAMTECGVRQNPDVQREVMENEWRKVEHATFRRMRDWYIYRDYMILLEYIKEQFTYLKEGISKESI